MIRVIINKNDWNKEEAAILDLKEYYEIDVYQYDRSIGGNPIHVVEIETIHVLGEDIAVIEEILHLTLGSDPKIRIIEQFKK